MKQKYLMKIFLLLSSVFSFAQTTYDFTTDATLSGAGGGWPWNTTADITIGGVAYRMTSGGNGSFSNVGSGGESNSKALRKDGAGGDSFTLQRADGQPFQFYGIWVNMQGLNSYSTIPGITLPPWYTLTAGSFTYQDMTPMTAGTAWNNYTYSSTSISPGAGGVNVTSVSINFPGINYYVIDNIVVGTAVVLNDPPTNITLSASSINENVAANSTIGTLSTTDPNSGNTFTYTLVSGTGDTHNTAFNISGNNLRITNSPNFETQANYSIRVRTTDQGGLTYEKSFAITINNQNETPTDIALTANSIDENVLANTPVGVFSSTDVDAANTFTYTLVAGTGSTDNASFNISGNSLRITNSPDFETKSSYAIRVRTTDQGSLTFEKQFTITINNLNEAPTDISLSATAINENVAANSTVGTLSSSDVDAANTFTYTLVAGTGSTDNASFNISGNSLRITNSPDFETKSSYAIRVRTTDQGSLFFEKQFTITINNLTETPATHLNFDGANDLVNLGTSLNTVLDPLNTITVEAWVRPSTNTGLGVIIGNYANSNQTSMQFLLRRDNNSYSFWMQGTGTFKNVIATNSVIVNTWQHLVGVWNGADLKIYVDGVLAGTTTGVNDSSFATTSNATIIGNNQAGTGAERFTGSIDEVRIWSTPRTIEQVNGSKNCELAGTESGLIAYYNFNQGNDAQNNSSVTTLNAVAGPNGILTDFTLNGATSNWLAGSPVTTGSVIPSSPTVSTPIVYAQGATASALTATVGANGTGLIWYTTATGGTGSTTAPTPSTVSIGNTSYWVSSTNANGCESIRTEIVVTVSLPATHLNFDGTNDMVGLGSSLSSTLNGANFFTAEAWINVPNTTGVKTIVGNHISNGAQFNLRIDGSRLNGFLGFGAYGANTSIGSIVANTWHHVAMVYNDTTLKLYIDGIEAASVNIPLAYSLQTSAQPYMIGASGYGGEFFNGSIDEVKIWNIAKTPDQLLATKNCELQGTESGLIAYYKFNQGVDQANNSAITTLLATTGPNGTITNFTLNGSTTNFLAGSPVATGSIVPSVASVTTPVTYNQGDTASALTATAGANGTGLMWYTTATGGTASATAPTPSTATVGSTSYWVSSTNANGCESARTQIVVNVIVANDECPNAINLSVGASSFNDFPANVNLTSATNSGAPAPTCGNFQGGDVWYTATVPVSGNIVIETNGAGIYDTGLEVYTGACGTLSLVSCDDNSGNGDYSKIVLLGQTPGTVLRIRVWENVFGISNAQFQVSAYDYIVPATHLNFDGVNDFVVSTNAITNNTENQTYQAWFRIPSIPANNDRILQRGNDGTGGWSVQIDVNAAGRLSAGISATPDTFITGTTVLTPNTWYHATFVFENNNSLRLYLNGNLEASIVIGNRTLRNSDNRLRIGVGNLASEHFNGDIDEVRVWNKVLNATDILNTMNCELQASETGLVAYYKFNQGNDSVNNSTVTSLLDSSSNANNGTLTSFTLTGATSNWRSGSTITTGNACATLGNSDFENVTRITIYPNPSTGIFNIVSQQNASVEIYDLLGKLVYNQSLANGTNSIDISNFNSGVYLLKATDANGNSETHKLIKN